MNMYNLIEYSDNHADSSGSFWQYKTDEQNMNNGNIADVTTNDSSSFRCKLNLLTRLTSGNIAANTNPDVTETHRLFRNAHIVIPVKYLSSFLRTTEMIFVNSKIHLELNWTENCII